MVAEFHFFPCEIFNYEYVAENGAFATGYITTTKGSHRFHATNLGPFPSNSTVSVLTRETDVPGFKLEILAAFPIISDPKIRKAIKTLCSLKDLTCDQIAAATRLIAAKEYAQVKNILPLKAYAQWCKVSGLGFMSLEDFLISNNFNEMFNDWSVTIEEFNILKSTQGDFQTATKPVKGIYVGADALEHVEKIVRPVPDAFTDISNEDLPNNIPFAICNNVIEVLEHAFEICGIVYLPIENIGQSIILDVAETIGITVYEAHEPKTIWDIATPCIIYGSNQNNPEWQHFLEAIKSGYPIANTPMDIALHNSGSGLKHGLSNAGSRYVIDIDKTQEYAERIQNGFNKCEPYRKTRILKSGDKEHVYRGIIVGNERSLMDLVHLCETIVWIVPTNDS